MKKGTRAAAFLGVLVSTVGLFITLRGLPFQEVARSFRHISLPPLLVMAIPLAFGAALRALRWNVLTRSAHFGASLEAVLVSAFFNGVLPFRSGEALRPVYFARRTTSPMAPAVGAAILERVLDVSTLAALGAAVMSGTRIAQTTPPAALASIAAILVLGVVASSLWIKHRPPSESSRLGGLMGEVARGLAVVNSLPRVAAAAGLSVVMWLVTAVPFALGLEAAGARTSFHDGLVVLLVVTFAIALPSAPGFIGTFHAGFVLGAQVAGIPRAIALPAAVVTHLLMQVPFILGGAGVLAFEGRAILEGVTAPERKPKTDAVRR